MASAFMMSLRILQLSHTTRDMGKFMASPPEAQDTHRSSAETPAAGSRTKLGDFTTDLRVLRLAAMAVLVGSTGALAAWGLARLIAIITDIASAVRVFAANLTVSGHHLAYVQVAIPVAGCLVIGLMARFGSEKIRGHGIPEAMEAILFGQSRI